MKVLDFGLLKAIDDGRTLERLSPAGQIHGTPALSPRSSVWAILSRLSRGHLRDGVAWPTGCDGELVFNRIPRWPRHDHIHTAPTAPSDRSKLPIPLALAAWADILSKKPEDRRSRARVGRRLAERVGATAWTGAEGTGLGAEPHAGARSKVTE